MSSAPSSAPRTRPRPPAWCSPRVGKRGHVGDEGFAGSDPGAPLVGVPPAPHVPIIPQRRERVWFSAMRVLTILFTSAVGRGSSVVKRMVPLPEKYGFSAFPCSLRIFPVAGKRLRWP